jgi:TolB-like protein
MSRGRKARESLGFLQNVFLVEEIITALSRIRWLFVIARNSTFTYKG